MPLHERQGYGDTSSSTRPFVSIANAPVMTAATSAARREHPEHRRQAAARS